MSAFQDLKASKRAFQLLQEREYIRYEDLPLRAKDGRLMQVEFISNVYEAGNKRVIQCNIRDVTEQRRAQAALVRSEALLREESVRDHLTGLFNRRYLEETLERELLRAKRKSASVGLLLMDIDNNNSTTKAVTRPAMDSARIGKPSACQLPRQGHSLSVWRR